jgi:hypothetical protein
MRPRHFAIDTMGAVARLHVLEGCETWLNGQPVREADLSSGDLISAGVLEVRFVDDQATKSVAVAPARAVFIPAVNVEDARGGAGVMIAGLALCLLALWMAYQGFLVPVRQLRPEDVVSREARLLSIQPHRRWLEAHFDSPPGWPVEMPRSLFASLFHVSWPCREELCGERGWPAVVGFERSALHGPATDLVGEPLRLRIVTLEVNGTAHRTLRQHNASLRDTASTARLTVLPLLMLGGFIVATGHSKWRSAREAKSVVGRA